MLIDLEFRKTLVCSGEYNVEEVNHIILVLITWLSLCMLS